MGRRLPTASRSFGFVSNEGIASGCSTLLLLDSNGQSVVEQPINCSGHAAASAVVRHWPVGASFGNAHIQAIMAVSGTTALALCGSLDVGGNAIPWALYGATDQGEVVSFCPQDEHLEPVNVIFAVPRLAGDTNEFIGLHVETTGGMWLLSQTADGSNAKLHSWSATAGFARKTVYLPPGKTWASGLCSLGPRRGFAVVVASNESLTVGHAHSELWHLDVTEAPLLQAAHFTQGNVGASDSIMARFLTHSGRSTGQL